MSASRFGRVQKTMALVPLVLLSAAWTASLAGVGLNSVAVARGEDNTLPDGTAIPTQAIKAPASVTIPGELGPAVPDGSAKHVIDTASANGIPAAALAAYQGAETIINAADPTCRLPWQLIAAIGRVESDHGRFGGNTLNADGVATPGIYGVALDGKNGTSVIRDTDAGQYDNDAVYDRAVGPMQFIPSTWSVVGVDADGDARRNPQDIDDAALATAVYLCSGTDDLGTDAGRRAAVFRYNHSERYVDLVLSIMNAYLQGDYTAVPNGTTSATYFPNDTSTTSPAGHHGTKHPGHTDTDTPTTTTPTDDGDGNPTSNPTNPPTSNPPTSTPASNPLDPVTSDPVDTVTDTVGTVLTQAEAVAQCTLDGYNALLDKAAWDQCIYDYTH
jgi:membrane-bound lytic murein transglycosylase B